MSKDDDVFKSLLAMGIAILLVPWTAYVATVMWGWFVVPLGVAAIGKAHAYGLMTMIGLLRNYNTDDESSIGAKIFIGIAVPALVLFAGFIAHEFMK